MRRRIPWIHALLSAMTLLLPGGPAVGHLYALDRGEGAANIEKPGSSSSSPL